MVNRMSVSSVGQQVVVTGGQLASVASIASHLPAAVRAQMALESGAILAGALEALAMAAFICDRAGTVLAMTPTAEALLATERDLCLKGDRLCVDSQAEAQALDDAIAAAAAADEQVQSPTNRTIRVRGGHLKKGPPLVLEVIPLPRREFEPEFAPRVLVVAKGMKVPVERRASVMQTAYALTAAETQIAMQLCAGDNPQAIATARGVTVGTVRTQIKTICAKLGVRRQAELVARLNDL